MTILSKQLKEDFLELKKSADSDNDVLRWFRQHPECLPELPTGFAPYLNMHINSSLTQNQFSRETGCLERVFSLVYEAEDPEPLAAAVTRPAFKAFTDDNIDMPTSTQHRPGYFGVLTINMAPVKWPYVAAHAALDVLKGGHLSHFYYKDRVLQAWQETFPTLPWETIESLYAAGLAPDDAPAFSQWLRLGAQPLPPAPGLPDNLAN